MYLDGSRKQIITWVAEGVSDAKIAERLRVSRSTVRYWRERNGVTRSPRIPKQGSKPGQDDASSSDRC